MPAGHTHAQLRRYGPDDRPCHALHLQADDRGPEEGPPGHAGRSAVEGSHRAFG